MIEESGFTCRGYNMDLIWSAFRSLCLLPATACLLAAGTSRVTVWKGVMQCDDACMQSW